MIVNGVLAKALREQIELHDLTIKEVAGLIHRDNSTVFRILNGEPVRKRTVRQIYIAFPAIEQSESVVMR